MIDVTVDREKFIGGSDLPIIMGISPFKSRFDLLLEKAGYKENDFKGNDYTEYGNILEPKIRNYINDSLYKKDPFKEDTFIDGDLRANVDGVNKGFILEIKTTSQIKNDLDDYKLYLVQLLFYMKVAKKKKGMLAVYERPEDFDEVFNENNLQTYMIDIDNFKELIEEIEVAIEQFRIDLKKVKENPLITEEDLQPKELIKISNEVVALELKLKEYKEIEKEQIELKSQLKIAMQKYGVKKWITPNNTKITIVADGEDKEVEVKKVDTEKFEKENADLISDFNKMQEKYNETQEKYTTTETEIKKGRSGYVKITLEKLEKENE